MERTDLAIELQEDMSSDVTLDGIQMKTKIDMENGIKEVKIVIEDERGSKLLRKPIGTYVTLECSSMQENDYGFHEELSAVLAEYLELLIPHNKRILVAGLGNRQITPDALGPYVIDHLFVTAHLLKKGYYKGARWISGIAPGVMAQTGMESGDILKGIIEETNAEILIVVDALAAKNSERLNSTIQICDTGISPGAGIGNHRLGINEETMGIPVIAVGVPTVIRISTIVNDVIEQFMAKGILEEEDLEHYCKESEFFNMFVTPKNVDEAVTRISYTVSEGINRFIAAHEEK